MTGVPFAVRFGLDATDNRVINVESPVEWNDLTGAKDATPRDWILERANWTKLAGRVGDLPINTAANPIRDGQTHLIKYRYGGEALSRLAVWDSSKTQVGGIKAIKVEVDPADISNVQGEAALGSTYPGEPFTGGNGDAVFDIVPNADGTVTATVTTAGSGYSLGEAYQAGPYGTITSLDFTVNELDGASATGGWRFVDLENYVKNTRADGDPSMDRIEGDILTTTEAAHKELKVFHNGAWVTLFSEDDIKAWIASLSLFEGTVKEVSGTAVGAIELSALPDLAAMTAAKDLGKVSHYWTFVGAPNTAVNAEYDVTGLTGGVPGTHTVTIGGSTYLVRVLTPTTAKVGVIALDSAVVNGANETLPAGGLGVGSSAASFTIPDITKLATPIIGTDLSGAILNPGDWIQIANRGTQAAPALGWVTIGGDLLAKARADRLFSLQQWVDGSWEKGSLITNEGSIYRAKQSIVTGDPKPGAGAGKAQIDIVKIAVPGAAGEVYTLNVNGNAATYTTLAGDGVVEIRTGLIDAISKVPAILLLASPSLGANADELALTAVTPGTPFVATMTTANLTSSTTQPNVLATTNPWEKVSLSGGVRWVQGDNDLPANAPAGEIYFVLSSAKAGGSGRLTYWDGGAAAWQDLGGGGGTPMNLSGGTIIYPDTLYWDGVGAKPVGKFINDVLYIGKTNSVERWTGTAWTPLLKGVEFGNAAHADHFLRGNAQGDLQWSDKTFEQAVSDLAVKTFPSVSVPSEDRPTNGEVNTFHFRDVKPGTRHRWVFACTKPVSPVMAAHGTIDKSTKTIYNQGLLALSSGNYAFQRGDTLAHNSYWAMRMDYGNNDNMMKENRSYTIDVFWYESKTTNMQHCDYQINFKRQGDDFSCVIFGKFWFTNAKADPVVGYAINSFAGQTLTEAYCY